MLDLEDWTGSLVRPAWRGSGLANRTGVQRAVFFFVGAGLLRSVLVKGEDGERNAWRRKTEERVLEEYIADMSLHLNQKIALNYTSMSLHLAQKSVLYYTAIFLVAKS